MRDMAPDSVDAIVTDPPYGLSFMGKNWDHGVPGEAFWREALRVAKPGAYLLAFGGTRTYHRLACAIEDAGWEVRDCVMWVYGSGFPKSMDVSKAIDRTNGTATQEAVEWYGWGTCLKPAWEPIIVARKPLEGTVAANVLKYGTGAINIDACRVPTEDNLNGGAYCKDGNRGNLSGDNRDDKGAGMFAPGKTTEEDFVQPSGRWPANLIHDGSEDVMECFPDNVKGGTWNRTDGARPFNNEGKPTNYKSAGSDKSVGSAARFFYCAKASRADRGEGNDHPTVKPIALMKYLVKLVCRQGGTVLDPFCGSGTTGIAAVELGDSFIGIERDGHYFSIAKSRVEKAAGKIDETAEL